MDVLGFLQLLRRRWPVIVLCTLAGIAGALLLTARTPPLYQADARVIVNIPLAGNVTQTGQGLQLSSELLPSYAELATSRRVTQAVKDRLDLPESVPALRSKLSAEATPQTLFINLGATDPDPVRARSIADATALALSDAVDQLQEGRDPATTVGIEVIDQAITPSSPVQPRPVYNLVLGLLLGLGTGMLVAVVVDALDRSVKSAEQAEQASGSPVLGQVPRFRRGADVTRAALDTGQPSSEAYRSLRTAIQFLDPDRPTQVFAVSSPSAGEGKTTTAVSLALALAESGEDVVLIDADLRRASVAEILGLEGSVGVTSVVTRTASIDEALQVWGDRIAVLPSGVLPPNPSEVVGSQRMGDLLQELRSRFDVVVVDAPPVLPVTDAVVLATQLDGVLLVVRAGRTARDHLAEARRRLDGVGASVLGCVLNAVPQASSPGYYAAYRPKTTPPTAPAAPASSPAGRAG